MWHNGTVVMYIHINLCRLPNFYEPGYITTITHSLRRTLELKKNYEQLAAGFEAKVFSARSS